MNILYFVASHDIIIVNTLVDFVCTQEAVHVYYLASTWEETYSLFQP